MCFNELFYRQQTGQKKALLHLSEDPELKRKWIYFVDHRDWSPTAHSVIYIDHFEDKFVKAGKKYKLLWQLLPVHTIHNESNSNPSLLKLR